MCPSEGRCAAVGDGVPESRRVCPCLGGCAPVWEGVHQCERVFPSVEGTTSHTWAHPPTLGHTLPHWGTVQYSGN